MSQEWDEERSDVGTAVAEHIALLSQANETPTEFEPAAEEISALEVDLTSPSWMTSLVSVQGWLKLPDSLDLHDPEEFLKTLAEALGFESMKDAGDIEDGTAVLTVAGLDRLNGRLQQALRLQEAFQADLEVDGGSVESATGKWREAWEEEEAEEDEGSGPVTAKAHTWNINEFSSRASRGKLNLSPSYQRGDVWPTSDSQMLIESILRGIPLPSVIILKPEGDQPYEVVDGKQRLTAILRFIGKHPRALETVEKADAQHPDAQLLRLFEQDYPAFRRAWKNVTGEQLTSTRERERYFPFKLRTGSTPLTGELAALQGKYYTDIRAVDLKIADGTVEVRELFEMVTDYKVPLIEYLRANRRQVHEVFNLYNKQGKHLNAEEIRNALFHDLSLMRALIVAAGDNTDMPTVAPFLEPSWEELSNVSLILNDYGFGTARYRRTKVLSWLAAMVFVDSRDEHGRPKRLSTARHIDSLLVRIETDRKDPFRDEATVREALLLLLAAMEAHASVDEAWAPRFRDTRNGTKWQELQLVASLLGVTLAASVLGSETADRLSEVAEALAAKTASKEWQRPEKTQTATQWRYVAKIALPVASEMGIDIDDASKAVYRRFGYSCVPGLVAVTQSS